MLLVSSVVRNEADRHLGRMLENVRELCEVTDGVHIVTDDCSEDDTAEICQKMGAQVRFNDRPKFWEHEGRARQEHWEFLGGFAKEGDWVLCLDADETISSPRDLPHAMASADLCRLPVVLLPLYEFWTETQYRIDGFWFGTQASRLFRWAKGGMIADKEMGCGSEPDYVRREVQAGQAFRQTEVHLLHWGYLREEDRTRKHAAYTSRLGGHGHHMDHVESIVRSPALRDYPGASHG